MIVMVIGGKSFDDREFVHKCMTAADLKKPFELVVPTAFEPTQAHVREWCQSAIILHARISPKSHREKFTMKDRFVFQPDALISFGTDEYTKPIVDYARANGVKVWEPVK